jgi:hypothetical protein
MSENKEQPDYETKIRTLRGEKTGWDFRFNAPPVHTTGWSPDAWIRFIGDGWIKIKEKVNEK